MSFEICCSLRQQNMIGAFPEQSYVTFIPLPTKKIPAFLNESAGNA